MIKLKCKNCGKEYQTYISQVKWRGSSYCSNICKVEHRIKNKELFIGKNSPCWKGGKRREKCKECGISISNWTENNLCKSCWGKKNRGKNHSNWKGVKRLRYHHLCWTSNYKKWRENVFKRDNFACQECGKIGGYLFGHHIKFWSKYPKLRYVVSNGVAECEKCHRYIHRFERLFEKSLNLL